MNDEELAEALANRSAPTVTKDGIEAQIVNEVYIRPDIIDTTLTICVLVLANGFHVVGESACADAANFDEEIGKKIARDKAFEKIWELEGYLLRERLHLQAKLEAAGPVEIPSGTPLVQMYVGDAEALRALLLSVRDKVETDIDLNDCLIVLDDAIQSIEANAPELVAAPTAKTITVADIAMACHEGNRTYCQSIGDDSQPAWEDAPEWQKQSAMAGVQFVIDNPDAPLSAQHDSWMAQKLADGWVYGEVKDEEAKTHPCMVPYDQLPPEQKAKDQLFRDTVHLMLTIN